MRRIVFGFFFIIISALLCIQILVPKIGDANKIRNFEKIAKSDRINRDFVWPDHVGFYTNKENQFCSDICLALFYSGRVEKVTIHQFTGTEVNKSNRFWLENRDSCPENSHIFHKSYGYELHWLSDFNKKNGTCLMMGGADPLSEPVQVIWNGTRRDIFSPETPRVSRLTILKSGTGLDLQPEESDILAQRTTIHYRDTPRLRPSYSLIGYGSLEATFVSKRIHQPYKGIGYDFSHYPWAGTKPYNALRYITNLGSEGLETAKFDEQQRYLDSLEGLAPTQAEIITNICEQFSLLRLSDFPLSEKHKSLLNVSDTRARLFPLKDKDALREANRKLSNSIIHAATLELEFLTHELNFEALNTELTFIEQTGYADKKIVRSSDYYPDYKQAFVQPLFYVPF